MLQHLTGGVLFGLAPAAPHRDRVAVGDYVIVHVGYALNKLDPEEAAKTLALFAEIGQFDASPTVH